jgi:hypothetical protein
MLGTLADRFKSGRWQRSNGIGGFNRRKTSAAGPYRPATAEADVAPQSVQRPVVSGLVCKASAGLSRSPISIGSRSLLQLHKVPFFLTRTDSETLSLGCLQPCQPSVFHEKGCMTPRKTGITCPVAPPGLHNPNAGPTLRAIRQHWTSDRMQKAVKDRHEI